MKEPYLPKLISFLVTVVFAALGCGLYQLVKYLFQ